MISKLICISSVEGVQVAQELHGVDVPPHQILFYPLICFLELNAVISSNLKIFTELFSTFYDLLNHLRITHLVFKLLAVARQELQSITKQLQSPFVGWVVAPELYFLSVIIFCLKHLHAPKMKFLGPHCLIFKVAKIGNIFYILLLRNHDGIKYNFFLMF